MSGFSSVQFKMVSMHSGKPICMRSTPSLRSFPNVGLIDDGPFSSSLCRFPL